MRLGRATPSLRLRWAGQRRQRAEERKGREAEAAFSGGLRRPGAGATAGDLRGAQKG
jgi:hypothetical protein